MKYTEVNKAVTEKTY